MHSARLVSVATIALSAFLVASPPCVAAAETPAASGAGDPSKAADFLIGTWTCSDEDWTYARLHDGSSWIHVDYRHGDRYDGEAVVGYVKGMDRFVYRDFHPDGAYADLAAKPPVDDRWVWTGRYYPASGPAVDVRITYATTGPALFDRTFEKLGDDGKYVKLGGDSCAKRT
jgi:hypothetical protein